MNKRGSASDGGRKPTSTSNVELFDPASALRSGSFDAKAVLILWCLRKCFYPLVWLGLTIAVWIYRDTAALVREVGVIDSPAGLFSDLLSPLAGVTAAIGLRLFVGWAALLAVYPQIRYTRRTHYSTRRGLSGVFRLWWDRLYLARGLRSLRWTWAVRRVAAERLGETGRRLVRCEELVTWFGLVSLLGLILSVLAQ